MIEFSSGSKVNRPNTFLDPTQDFTIGLFIKQSIVDVGQYNQYYLYGDVTSSNPYIYLGSNGDNDNLYLEVFDGTNYINTTPISVGLDDKKYAAIVHVAGSNQLKLYYDDVLIETLSVNFDFITFVETLDYCGGDGASNVYSVGYLLTAQRAYSLAELTAQSASITVVDDEDLLSYCPLQASIDLTAHNNTATQFEAILTVLTDTDDPLVSIVSAPPGNTTPASASAATVDSALFQDTLVTGSAASEVWFKCTAPNDAVVMAACAFGDTTTFKPDVTVYEGLANANANTPLLSIVGNDNEPIQFPVTEALVYYFRCRRNGAVSPATIQFSVLLGLNLPMPAGSLAINDDTAGFPLVVMNSATGYPIYFKKVFAAGDFGVTLPSGILLASDEFDALSPILYLPNLDVISRITSLSGFSRISSDSSSTFFIGKASTGQVKTVSSNGTVGSTSWTVTSGVITYLAPSRDRTILYYVDNAGANKPIKRWDLVNDVALTDLVVGIANYLAGKDILVLSDGTILVMYHRLGVNIKVLRYSTTGVVLNTYDFGNIAVTNLNQRMCLAVDNASFWVVISLNSSEGLQKQRITNILVADGSTIVTYDRAMFREGIYASDEIDTPSRYGQSDSCPVWITRIAEVIAKSGLYILSGTGSALGAGSNAGGPSSNAGPNTVIRHDVDWIDTTAGTSEDVKIPDPYYDTYLAGDE